MSIDAGLLVEWTVKALVLSLVLLTGFAYTTYLERKLIARFQVRIGPNQAGPYGLLQPLADGLKLIFKEEIIPDQADKVLFVLAPIITVIPSLAVAAVIPWGEKVTLFGREVTLYLADVPVGVLYLLAVASLMVYGIVLAGWASNSKYPLLGGLRASAQMISYELALGLSFVGPVLLAGSMKLGDIVRAQQQTTWFAVLQPLGLVVYFIAALAELNRSPFDLLEAEQELTGGYNTEYSGMKFASFYMAEYVKMIVVSAIAATLFFGGYSGPGVARYPALGPLYLAVKIFFLLAGMVWVRATLPRLRYDRLMALGWKVLFPLALLNVLLTAAGIVVFGG